GGCRHARAAGLPAGSLCRALRAAGCGLSLAGEDRLTDDLRAMHQAAQALVEGIPPMHDAAIVPQHEIAGAPFLVPRELLLRGMRPDSVQKLLAFLDGEAVDIGARTAAEEERLAPGDRMQADQGVHCTGRVTHVEGALEALAQLAGRVAARIVDARLAF